MDNGARRSRKKALDYVKSIVLSNNRICYVCSIEDDDLIEQMLQSASPNPELSKFPDFICDCGFIEHFEVTSSHSNRKGSTMKHEQHKLKKEAETKEQALMAEMDEVPCCEGKSVTADTWHSQHTYDDFCYSFKKSWEHHIESLSKYGGNKSIGIFLVQYNDSALVLDAVYPDVKTEIYYGDLLKRPDYGGYRLTHDSNMLEYIYQFKKKIQYVAFFNNDGFHGKRCEIICVENIPDILKIVKGKYRFHCAMIGTAHTFYGISVPNQHTDT
ncbi:MAG: hypothetical protein NC235_14840 [Clostridiales bacterium]|nr:hypothetical protein [Clostridiales bacterium]